MEVAETLNKILKEASHVLLVRESPPNQGTFTYDPGGISTINWRILYQESGTKKATIGETNKSTKDIIEISQET